MKKRSPHIAVDIGNSRIKTAEFYGTDVKNIQNWKNLTDFSESIQGNPGIVISSVALSKNEVLKILGAYDPMYFDHQTPLPISVDYETPETLGLDRIAAAVGAYMEFKKPCLVVDFGSCITYDLVDAQGHFLGGAIAPGLGLRMRAMHEFTANLPNVLEDWQMHETGFPGKTTRKCMVTGVRSGIQSEIQGFVDTATKKFGKINVILTGGDTPFFESMVKAAIFVRPNLVMRGLNQILMYNEVN